jgi:hypothetical protein
VREWSALAALLAALVSAACQHLLPGSRHLAGCPGALRPVGEIQENFLLDQRVRIRSSDADASLRIAVEKRGSQLVLIGLNELGAKLFTVIQTQEDVEVDALPAAVLPVAPLDVLRDLHRVRFLGVDAPPDARGRAETLRDGTRIAEYWSNGTLRRRTFVREAEPERGEVSVEFSRPDGPNPTRVRIDNGWCNYTALIDTLAEEPLP